MNALGALSIFIVYIFLGFLLIMGIYQGLKTKNQITESIKMMLLAALPLIIWTSYRYYSHRAAQPNYVGKYLLTEYPKCASCILELRGDNFYQVIENERVIEEGEWSYDSGGDYWIVEIGEHGQLGTGDFKYSEKVSKQYVV